MFQNPHASSLTYTSNHFRATQEGQGKSKIYLNILPGGTMFKVVITYFHNGWMDCCMILPKKKNFWFQLIGNWITVQLGIIFIAVIVTTVCGFIFPVLRIMIYGSLLLETNIRPCLCFTSPNFVYALHRQFITKLLTLLLWTLRIGLILHYLRFLM